MTDIYLTKTPTGALVPADSDSAEYLKKHKVGQGFKAKITRARNVMFHRKFFALLNYGFDTWKPLEAVYHGQIAEKNFKQFREDITILAGYFERFVRMDGSVQLRAKSISFANMDEDEFESLYSAVIDVLLKRIFINQTRGDVENVVNNILAFS